MFFLFFWPTSITGEGGNGCEVPGNGEALEGMVEVSPEAQEGGGVVERYPEATPQDVGLTTLPCCPEDPLQCLL